MKKQTREELLDIAYKLSNLYIHIIYQFDLEKNEIDFIFKDNNIIQKHTTISKLLDFIVENENILNKEKNKILSFLEEQRQSNKESFSTTFECITNNSETITLTLKGVKTGNKVLCAINNNSKDIKLVDSTDSLTKTYSENKIISKIKAEFKKQNNSFNLILVNVDDFTKVNKEYGQMFGDVILVEVAGAIRKTIADSGYIGRLNQDEFLICTYGPSDYDSAWNICENIKHTIRNISNENSKNAKITATIACSRYPDDGSTFDELFIKLLKAMTRGKSIGKDRFIIYTNEKCAYINYQQKDKNKIESEKLQPEIRIIASIFDMMNRHLPIIKNLKDSLALIGTFFTLDKITLNILENSNEEIHQTLEWINPELPELGNLSTSTIDAVNLLHKHVNSDGYFLCSHVPDKVTNSDVKELYTYLKNQKTQATLAFELTTLDNNLVGTLRFDHCKSHHVWQNNEIHYLALISKIFSSSIQKYMSDKKIAQKLYTDELTGLYNQSKFISLGGEFLLDNSEPKASLLAFNFRHFQYINEQYGYAEGNKILIKFAHLLKEYLPKDSIFCRITSDKFLALIKSQNKDIITKFFDSICKQIHLMENDSFVRRVNLVTGVYFINKLDDIYTAIDLSTLAMRSIPEGEVSAIAFYSDIIAEDLALNVEIEEHMFTALHNEEYVLYYQPKFDINSGEIIGAEALTRWNFKNKRLLMPYQFIGLFEKNGFIVELDFYVFEKVCSFLSKLISNNKKVFPISVNMSRYQLNFNQYVERIEKIRKTYGVSPALIEIEITEGLTSNIELIKELINKLHEIGYVVSMDDFGSGYSNLASLSSLDFDTIKLDKGFCSNSNNEKENIVISNVIKMAYELNINVLCEGVETKEQENVLNKLGCKQVQGWLYDKALPEAEFIKKYVK